MVDDVRQDAGDTGPAVRLILLRHGEVEEGARGRLYGQLDVALSDHGREQSRRAAAALAGAGITAVYSSDLTRAAFLAREIGQVAGVSPTLTEALRERHFGEWQEWRWEEIERRHPAEYRAYWADRYRYRAPGGAENFADVQARVLPLLAALRERHAGETVAITAHSGPLRLLIADVLGLPVEGIFSFAMDFCSMAMVTVTASGARLECLNSHDYARAAGAAMPVA